MNAEGEKPHWLCAPILGCQATEDWLQGGGGRTMKTPEEYALQVAPEGCDGNHPEGGCRFERIRDVIWEAILTAKREAETETRERCAKKLDALADERARWAEQDETGLVVIRAAVSTVRNLLSSAYGDPN